MKQLVLGLSADLHPGMTVQASYPISQPLLLRKLVIKMPPLLTGVRMHASCTSKGSVGRVEVPLGEPRHDEYGHVHWPILGRPVVVVPERWTLCVDAYNPGSELVRLLAVVWAEQLEAKAKRQRWVKCKGCGGHLGFFPDGWGDEREAHANKGFWIGPGGVAHTKPIAMLNVPNSVPCKLYRELSAEALTAVHADSPEVEAPTNMRPRPPGN